MKRWSTLNLELQFGLFGHWGRQSEGCNDHGESLPGNPMRMLKWRSQKWWRHQQSPSRSVGVRHAGCFYADSTERRFTDNIDLDWEIRTKDRSAWRASAKHGLINLILSGREEDKQLSNGNALFTSPLLMYPGETCSP